MTDFGSGAARLARAAAMLFGWRPWEFWDSTPAEVAAVLQPDEREGAGTETLAELMRRFPDERNEHG